MSNNSKNICRLCFGVEDISGEKIDDIHKDLLDVLLINTDWSLIESPTLCENCCRKLHESFTFKANCIDIEDYSTPIKDNGEFDLRKVCTLLKPSKAVNNLCRLCVEWISDQEVTLTDIEKEKFKLYLPEIDLESSTNPVICSECYNSFQSFLSFAESCIQNEQKLVEYCKKLKKRIKSPIVLNKFLEYLESPNSSTRVGHLNRKVRSEKLDEYKCDVCFYTTKSVTEIKAHKLSHVNSPDIVLLKCPLCPLQTRHKASLGKHINTIHSDKKYSCDSCSFVTKHKVSLARHVANHNASILECKSCNFKTKFAASLENHTCRVKQVKKELKCPECSYTTTKKSSLAIHSTRHKPLSELKMYKCNFCEYKSVLKRTVAIHMLIHKEAKKTITYKCHHCQFETFGKHCLNKHLQQHDINSDSKIFTKVELTKRTEKCSRCDFEASDKWGLNRHIRMEHRKPNVKKKETCSICGYRTSHTTYFRQHMNSHLDPSQVEMFKCDECPFESKWANSLNDHKNIHRKPSEMKLFKCDECPFESKRARSLLSHKRRHLKPDMFKCDECPFKTKWEKILTRHKEIHRQPIEVKMFKCEKCPFESKWPKSLGNHKKIHLKSSEVNMLKCDECPFMSKWPGSLNNHKKIHRKLSHYQYCCTLYPLQSKYKKSLGNHFRDMHGTTKSMNTKSDEKTYHCTDCTYKTNSRQNIVRHIANIHGKGQLVEYNCDKCSFTSSWRRSLLQHQIIHKDIEDLKLYECKYCNFKTKYERNLRNHISNRHDHEHVAQQ